MHRLAIALVVCGLFPAAGLAEDREQDSWDMLTAKPEVVEAWQDMRFGMFNCWGGPGDRVVARRSSGR